MVPVFLTPGRLVATATLLLVSSTPGWLRAAENRRPPVPLPPSAPPAVADARPVLDAARRALAEGLPIVAAHRLTLLLGANPPPAPDARREATLLLARAWLESGDARTALNALAPPTEETGGVSATAFFLRAQAHAALGEWTAALDAYERAITAAPDPAAFPERDAARFGRAETLRALGRRAEAGRAFEELRPVPAFSAAVGLRRAELALEAGQNEEAERLVNAVPDVAAGTPSRTLEKRLLAARLRLARGRAAEAEAMLTELLRAAPRGFTEELLATAYGAWAESRRVQGRVSDAVAALAEFADRYPRHPGLGKMLGRMDALLAENSTVDLAALTRWSRDDTEPGREALATLALAHARRRGGQVDAAEALLVGFPARFPDDPRRPRALLDLAELQLARRRLPESRASLAQVRAAPALGEAGPLRRKADELAARIAVAGGEFARAAALYERIARAPETPPARVLAADSRAALSRLRAGDEEGFTAARRELERRFPDGNAAVREALGLEEVLIRVARVAGQPWTAGAAGEALRKFLREQPGSPQSGAARVALAELAFGQEDFEGARSELRAVANVDAPGGAPPSDRADALAVWLADAPGPRRDAAEAATRARAFLARWPASPLVAGVRLKLGEILFRQEDYPAAQTELESVGTEAGASPAQVENARYLAGLAALRGLSSAGADRAVSLFEDAAKIGGPLRPAARLRQAETLRDRLGKPADALLVYDAVLAAAAPPPDPATRCAALCGKGETLLANPAQAREAAGWFEQAASVRDAPLGWRRQALTRQGEALEKIGNTAAALAAYDDALNAADAGDAAVPEGEFVWFYRAGFAAARLLRASGQWKAAIAVYGKVAAPDGPLRGEAETQARALRLEHFVWDES